MAKHDSKSSDDPTGGLGNVIEVLDGTTYLQLYAEDRPAAHFIINEPPPPKWVTDTLDKATTDTNVLGCAQAQAIDMLGQNGVIRLQDVFGQELQEACASK